MSKTDEGGGGGGGREDAALSPGLRSKKTPPLSLHLKNFSRAKGISARFFIN